MTNTCQADSGVCATCGLNSYECEAAQLSPSPHIQHTYVPRPCGAALVFDACPGLGDVLRGCRAGHTAWEARGAYEHPAVTTRALRIGRAAATARLAPAPLFGRLAEAIALSPEHMAQMTARLAAEHPNATVADALVAGYLMGLDDAVPSPESAPADPKDGE